MSLTEEGEARVGEVLDTLFLHLALLRAVGPCPDLADELQEMSEVRAHWRGGFNDQQGTRRIQHTVTPQRHISIPLSTPPLP